MKRMLFGLALLLFLAWVIGFFIFNAGKMIHLSGIISAIAYMQAVIITPKPQEQR